MLVRALSSGLQRGAPVCLLRSEKRHQTPVAFSLMTVWLVASNADASFFGFFECLIYCVVERCNDGRRSSGWRYYSKPSAAADASEVNSTFRKGRHFGKRRHALRPSHCRVCNFPENDFRLDMLRPRNIIGIHAPPRCRPPLAPLLCKRWATL